MIIITKTCIISISSLHYHTLSKKLYAYFAFFKYFHPIILRSHKQLKFSQDCYYNRNLDSHLHEIIYGSMALLWELNSKYPLITEQSRHQ